MDVLPLLQILKLEGITVYLLSPQDRVRGSSELLSSWHHKAFLLSVRHDRCNGILSTCLNECSSKNTQCSIIKAPNPNTATFTCITCTIPANYRLWRQYACKMHWNMLVNPWLPCSGEVERVWGHYHL